MSPSCIITQKEKRIFFEDEPTMSDLLEQARGLLTAAEAQQAERAHLIAQVTHLLKLDRTIARSILGNIIAFVQDPKPDVHLAILEMMDEVVCKSETLPTAARIAGE
jgi:hypothetical protein